MNKKKGKSKNNFFPYKWLLLGIAIIILIILSLLYKKNILHVNNLFTKRTETSVAIPTKTELNINILGPNELILTKDDYINMSILDLSKKLAIDKNIIKINKVEPKTWSNSSL